MSKDINGRLNQILPTVTEDSFLQGSGLGNELAFHIFDYPPEHELLVRQHVRWLVEQIPKHRPGLEVLHVNLFEFLINHLRNRGLLDRSFEKQRDEGDTALRKALRGPLHEGRLAKEFVKFAKPEERDLLLVDGVGSAYPLVRPHSLLNNLHPIMGQTPLVLFYPGRYDGTHLCPFGKSTLSSREKTPQGGRKEPYYRAFRLIP